METENILNIYDKMHTSVNTLIKWTTPIKQMMVKLLSSPYSDQCQISSVGKREVTSTNLSVIYSLKFNNFIN